jgi:hypothetical protein
MTIPFSQIQTLIPSNNIKVRNKFYYIYGFHPSIEIAVGRSQDGNQQILDLYKADVETENKCWWFHLQNQTSAHAIVHELHNEDINVRVLKQAFDWIYNVLFANNKNDLIFTKLSNIKCTKTKGLVTYKDEQYVSKINWG